MHIPRALIKVIIFCVLLHSISVIGILYFLKSQNRAPQSIVIWDNDEFFEIGRGIIQGKPAGTIHTIGWALILIPFIWLFKPLSMWQIFLPVLFFNSLILYNISIALVALIALKLTRNFKISYAVALLWTLFPWLVYFFVKIKPAYDYSDLSLSRLLYNQFLAVSTDSASTTFVFFTIYLFLIFLGSKKYIDIFLLSFIFAFAGLIRIQNLSLIALILPIYIIRGELKKSFLFVAASFFFFTPQLFYNWITSRSLLNIGRLVELETIDIVEYGYNGPFYSLKSIPYNLYILVRNFSFPVLLILGIIFILVVTALAYLFKKNRLSCAVLFLWVSSYLITYGLYYGLFYSFLRYLLPIVPAILIATTIGLFKFRDILAEKLKNA